MPGFSRSLPPRFFVEWWLDFNDGNSFFLSHSLIHDHPGFQKNRCAQFVYSYIRDDRRCQEKFEKGPRDDGAKIPDELGVQIFANMNIYEPAPVGKFG